MKTYELTNKDDTIVIICNGITKKKAFASLKEKLKRLDMDFHMRMID